jgi:hypothetical protein
MKREDEDSRLLAAILDESANLTIHFTIDVS